MLSPESLPTQALQKENIGTLYAKILACERDLLSVGMSARSSPLRWMLGDLLKKLQKMQRRSRRNR